MKAKFLLTVLVILKYLSTYGQNDIISAAQFMDLLNAKEDIAIIDAGSPESYNASHIKDAINIFHKNLYREGPVDGIIKSPGELAKYFGSKGISDESKIIVYDDGSQKFASRIYWVLKYLGARDVKILHKDMTGWEKVRIPLTGKQSEIIPSTFTPNVDASIYANISYVKKSKGSTTIKLIDTRTPEEFTGTSEKPVSKGHIPGAINLNYKDVLTYTGAFRSKTQLDSIASTLGLNANDELILYCRTSVRAAVLYIAFRAILGYDNVRIYDGAYTEWETKYRFEK